MPRRQRSAAQRLLTAALAVAVLLVGCARADRDLASLQGESLTVLASWSGAEQVRFEQVLADFAMTTDVSVRYIPATPGVADELAIRTRRGDTPDVAFLPQPGVLRDLAAEGRLLALDGGTQAEVEANYDPVWQELASYDGTMYGVWFKAANKSLIWYDVAAFERLGLVPPARLDDLLPVARAIAQHGTPAFGVAGGSGWTLTDWFENLYLRLSGARRYDLLAAHRMAWTDPTVEQALTVMGRLLAPGLIQGGVAGALETTFVDSIAAAFGDPGGAAMVAGGDFVAGMVRSETQARVGTDVDVVPFPAGPQHATAVMGGGDVAVLLHATPAGRAFLRYLATPGAGAIWAANGGFLSPNLNLDLAVYPDEITRSIARQLLDAGADFRFDLSDLQPTTFGGSEDAGMRPALQQFLADHDVRAAAERLEAGASAAYLAGPS